MSQKLSKSNTTPEMEAVDKEAAERLRAKKCQHFAQNTFVMMNNRRGEVLENFGRVLLVAWDDGSVSFEAPIALNR